MLRAGVFAFYLKPIQGLPISTVEKQRAIVAMGLPPKKRAKLAGLILESLESYREAALRTVVS